MRKSVWACLAVALCSTPLHGGSTVADLRIGSPAPAPPSVEAASVVPGTSSILIDGELTEPIWATAQPVNGFLQREPNEGAAPTHPTEVRVAFDEKAIYVAVTPTSRRPIGSARCSPAATTARLRTGSACSSIRTTIAAPRSSSPSTPPASSRTAIGTTTPTTTSDGTRCGTWPVGRSPEGWRAEFRIPVLAIALQSRVGRHVRLRSRPHRRAQQRDVHMAAAGEERQRLRLVVRRSHRPDAHRRSEEARVDAVRRRRKWRPRRSRPGTR